MALGNVLKTRLNDLKTKAPQISDVRGPGAMNAVEFIKIQTQANPT